MGASPLQGLRWVALSPLFSFLERSVRPRGTLLFLEIDEERNYVRSVALSFFINASSEVERFPLRGS